MKNVLYIDKPVGMSSFDVCFKLRKILNTKKIGHTGTLDPNASGVMVVLFDSATKLNQFLVNDNKTYKTRVKFGIETDTLDTDGNIIKQEDYVLPSKELIVETLNSFLGESKQVVPLTSAIKVDGKRLYQYQLENKEVELPIHDINVYTINLDEMYDDGFSFTCKVSSGTYIRALVRDIVNKLNIIGTVSELQRTQIDNISIDECDKLEDVLNNKYTLHDAYDLISKRYEMIEYPSVEDIKNGKRIKINCNKDMVAICNNKQLLAIYKKENDEYKCVRGLW